MSSQNNKSNGFTIIEVLIVIAIFGLIIMVILLAVPPLQRNARNHSRKNTAANIAIQMDNYKLDHSYYPGEGGNEEAEMCDFMVNYMMDYVGKGATCNPTFQFEGGGDGRDCVYVESPKGNNMCFRSRPNADHDTEGQLDDFYIIVAHWCNRGPHYNDYDEGAPITGEDGPHPGTANTKGYAVYTPLENGPAYCVDNDITTIH